MTELENLFSVGGPNSDQSSTGGKARRPAAPKTEKVQLVLYHLINFSLICSQILKRDM